MDLTPIQVQALKLSRRMAKFNEMHRAAESSDTRRLVNSGGAMCRNIKTLFNFEPPASPDEVRAASVQFVRKISGSTKPSQANEASFERAVSDVSRIVQQLLDELVTSAAPKNREVEREKARARSAARFGTMRPTGAG